MLYRQACFDNEVTNFVKGDAGMTSNVSARTKVGVHITIMNQIRWHRLAWGSYGVRMGSYRVHVGVIWNHVGVIWGLCGGHPRPGLENKPLINQPTDQPANQPSNQPTNQKHLQILLRENLRAPSIFLE